MSLSAGRIGGAGIGAYPVRPPGDPAALERGTALYKINCAFCHGHDARGGDGGPSLRRSGLVLADENGELIGPVLEQGRGTMPKFGFKRDQVADLAVFLHSFRVAGYDLRGIATRMTDERVLQQSWLMPGSMARRGGPAPVRARPPSVTVTEHGKPPVTGTLGRLDDFVVSFTTMIVATPTSSLPPSPIAPRGSVRSGSTSRTPRRSARRAVPSRG